MRKALIGLGILAAFFVAVAVISPAPPPAATPNPNATTVVNTPEPTGSAQAQASPEPSAAAVQPIVLLKASGDGMKDTQSFTTSGGQQTLAYTYNCKSFGLKGNFIVTINGDTFAIAVNELGMSGSDKTYPNLGPGTYSLSINSECKWTVSVTGMP